MKKIFETLHLIHTLSLELGWYIYLETSSVPANASARLQSEPIAGSTTKCFEFWYHMHGPDVNRLDVLVLGATTRDTIVWTRQGPQGNAWRLGKVKLNDITDMYRVCKISIFDKRILKCCHHFRLLWKVFLAKVFEVILHWMISCLSMAIVQAIFHLNAISMMKIYVDSPMIHRKNINGLDIKVECKIDDV